MKKILKRLLFKINYKVLMRNIILLESNPDLTDNTYAVFKELINRRINYKYRIIWSVNSNRKEKYTNVKYINKDKNFLTRLAWYYYHLFSKYIIDCNRQISKLNKNQFRIHLTHGEPIKDAYNACIASLNKVDYILETSDFFKDFICRDDGLFTENQILILGYPRNDDLLKNNKKALDYIKSFKSKKVIVWIPTYRNLKTSKEGEEYFRTNITFKFGVPCIENVSQAIELNDLLKEYRIMLIIKPHPAEDVSKINELKLSNIIIINDDELYNNNINLYQLLHYSDAIITDYSSIYYDYLLTQKPIGLAISDFEEYSKSVHLYCKQYKKDIIGEYIYNYNELLMFIKNVNNGIDNCYNERMEKMHLYHRYIDGDSSKRVVEFFLKKIGESN